MARLTTFTFEDLSNLIVKELQDSHILKYVPDTSIVPSLQNQKDTIPQFTNYLIRVSPADSGFVTKQPKIGQYYRNIYAVAIELWVKSFQKLAGRLTTGNLSAKRGLYEFYEDVSRILEHNTFDSQIDPYPGSSISQPVALKSDEEMIEGIGFIWFGNQDNIK